MSFEKRGQVILSVGNTSENAGWKAPRGVITLDIERGAIHIHDGETYGGLHTIYLPDAHNFIEAQAAGKADGVATLDSQGFLSQDQWPKSMHQITGYGEMSLFPKTGEADEFYLDQSTLTLYAWHAGGYVALNPTVSAKSLGLESLVDHKPLVDTDAHKLMALETTGVITGAALAVILKDLGIIQDSTGKWGWDMSGGGNSNNGNGELPDDDATKDSDGISHIDTATTTRLMMRPVATINTAFISDTKYTITNGFETTECNRFKYGSSNANYHDTETFGGQVFEETKPMYVYSKDKMECAIGVIDNAGSNPKYRQPAYIKFTGFEQQLTLQKLEANIKDAILALPMSFGMVDQPDTLNVNQFTTDYTVEVLIKGQSGSGILYTSGVNKEGTAITMTGKIGDEVVESLVGLVEEGKGHPFQGILAPRLTKEQAATAFPSNSFNTADGLNYVQVVGELEIIMTVTYHPNNQSADIPIYLTINAS